MERLPDPSKVGLADRAIPLRLSVLPREDYRMTESDAETWTAHLVRYPNRPAPKETYQQYLRGEISIDDYLWLTGSKASDPKKDRVKRRSSRCLR